MAKEREIMSGDRHPDEPKDDAGVTLGTERHVQSTPLRIAIQPIGNDRSRLWTYAGGRVKVLTLVSREELIALRTEINRALDAVTK
jgi:hypothetical protein